MNIKYLILVLLAGTCITTWADVVAWPADGDWIPLYSEGALYSDIPGDIGNNGHEHLDIVGDATNSAAYMLYREDAPTSSGGTENQLLFRIRLDDDKNKMSGAYQIFFETDGDSSVEWVLQLTTSDLDSSGILEFGAASGTNRNGVTFGSVNWTGSYSEYVHWEGTPTADGSQFDGNPDYYLDIAVPWDVFSASSGISSTNDPFRILITSSQSGGQIDNGDVGNSSVASSVDLSFSDVYSDSIPEPAVAVLLVGFGSTMLAGRRIFKKTDS
ncbi:MAG: hypothetical protein ABFR47_04720 [Verrucomicrobiota bacterium]